MIEFLLLAAVASWVAAAPDKKTLAARGGAAGAVRAAAATARTQARTEWPTRANSRSAKGRTNGRTKGRVSRWATGNSTGARRLRRTVRAGMTAVKAARTVTRAAVTAGRVAIAVDRIAVAGVRALPEGYRTGAARAVEARERRRSKTPVTAPDPAPVSESAPQAPAGDGSGYDIELERVGPLWRGRVLDGEGRTVADYMGTHRTAMEQASADIDRRVGSDAREAQARARAEQGGDEIEMTNVGPLWRSRVLNDQGQAVADHWGTHRSALERASAAIDRREAVDLRVLPQSVPVLPEAAPEYAPEYAPSPEPGLLSVPLPVPQPSAALRESLRRSGLDDEGRPLPGFSTAASSTPSTTTPDPAPAGPVNPSTTTKESTDMAEIVEFETTTDLRNEAAELEAMAEEIHTARAEFERRTKALEEKVGAAPFGTRAIAEAVTAVGEAPTTDAAAEALLELRRAVDEADALAEVAESLQAEGDVRAYAAN